MNTQFETDPPAHMRGPMEHDLKVWPQQFEALNTCAKMHEVRKFDRDYRVGDTLNLREFDPASGEYTGRRTLRMVTHITAPGTFGLPPDVGVMSVSLGGINPALLRDQWPFPKRPA